MFLRIFTVFMCVIVIYGKNFAQDYAPWVSVYTDPNTTLPGKPIYSQNLNEVIYTGVHQREDATHYISAFDGENWNIFLDSVITGFTTIVDYDDGILAGTNSYLNQNGELISAISYFDGTTWSRPWFFNDGIRKLKWVDDTLWALGIFTEIDGEPAYYVARLVDGTWEGMLNPSDDISFALFGDIAYYQGNYYIGGNFESITGPDDLAILENGTLHYVGEGLTGAFTSVSALVEYQEELYIGGLIAQSQGNIANHLLRWNGETFNGVGDTIFDENELLTTGGPVNYLQVREGYLYASGAFGYIGDLHIPILARYDGSQWCGFHTGSFDYSSMGFAFIDNKILLFVPFTTVGGQSSIWWLYENIDDVGQCTEPLALKTAQPQTFELYPNPSSGIIYIQSVNEMHAMEIVNALGQRVFTKKMNGKAVKIDLTTIPPGMYLVRVETEVGDGVQKLIIR